MIPDHCNCDLSTYTDEHIEGGKVLRAKAPLQWNWQVKAPSTTLGGICDECLTENPTVRALFEHIILASETEMFK